MTDPVIIYGNGAGLHDRIALVKGDFAKAQKRIRAKEDIVIGVVRKNAFLLDKILLFVAETIGEKIDPHPFSASPIADIALRYNDYLQNISDLVNSLNIKIKVMDERLIELFEKVQSLAETVSETELLRLLGVICETPIVGPHWFVFETINACNSDCWYCNIHSPTRKPSEKFLADRLPFSVFESIMDDLEHMGIDGVTILANGEPLLHPDFVRMISTAKSKNVMVNFFTNGLLLNRSIANVLVKSQVDEAFVTISAATEKTYLALHSKQKTGDYQRVLDNFAYLRDAKQKHNAPFPKVTGVHVICSENVDETFQMAKQAEQLGFSKLRFALIRLDEHNKRLALTKENISSLRDQLPKLRAFCDESGIELWEGYRFQLENADDPEDWSGDYFVENGCLIGWGLGLVKANADLSFCCVVKPIANLKSGGRFREIWNGNFYQAARVIAKNNLEKSDFSFLDGSALYTSACRHCDNHDINAMLHQRLAQTGLDDFLK